MKKIQKGKNNPNYKDGRTLKQYYCIVCRDKICYNNWIEGSKLCKHCCKKLNNPFKNKQHSKQSKQLIGKKSRAKFTKKYKQQIRIKYQGNKKKDTNNYILIKDYNRPNRNSHNDMLEHRLVMEKYLGRYLTKEEIVHHINFVKNHNLISNLHLYKNRKEHLKTVKSLYKLVKGLLKLKIITFKKGKYLMRRNLGGSGGKS